MLFSEYMCKTDLDKSGIAHSTKILYCNYANNALN